MRDEGNAIRPVRCRELQETPASLCRETTNQGGAVLQILEIAEAGSEVIQDLFNEGVMDLRGIPAQLAYGPKRENQPTPIPEREFSGQILDNRAV